MLLFDLFLLASLGVRCCQRRWSNGRKRPFSQTPLSLRTFLPSLSLSFWKAMFAASRLMRVTVTARRLASQVCCAVGVCVCVSCACVALCLLYLCCCVCCCTLWFCACALRDSLLEYSLCTGMIGAGLLAGAALRCDTKDGASHLQRAKVERQKQNL